MPKSVEEEAILMRDFKKLKNFPGVIGAIDCTHIKIKKVGGEVAQYYINRKGFYSLNVQVCFQLNSIILCFNAYFQTNIRWFVMHI